MGFDTVALFLWLLVFSFAYPKFRDPKVYLITNMLGAWLFLPESSIELPLLPDLTKETIASISSLISMCLFGGLKKNRLKLTKIDGLMLLFCIIPVFTSISNNLGIWDGLSSLAGTYLVWGVPYFIGRKYFTTLDDLKVLLLGGVIAAVIYLPFILYEIKMSPNLHQVVYGFNQSSWAQHVRYGGWRPKVFLQHGLMLSLFVSISVSAIFTLRIKDKTIRIIKFNSSVIEKILIIMVFVCKSGNGVVLMLLAVVARLMTKLDMAKFLLLILICSISVYLATRVSGYWDGLELIDKVESISGDKQRAGSLGARIRQENLFLEKADEKWLFGWGGWGRAFPVDEYGVRLTRGVDSKWIIAYSENGIFELISFFGLFLSAPFVVAVRIKKGMLVKKDFYFIHMAAFIPVFYMIDCLANDMDSPWYFMISGSLITLTASILSGQYKVQQNHV